MSKKIDNRGQAFTLEAIIALILLSGVVIFLVPSAISTPLITDQTSVNEDREAVSDTESTVKYSYESGFLTAELLYSDFNEWAGEISPTPYQGANQLETELGDEIEELQDRHDIVIGITVTAHGGDESQSVDLLDATVDDGDFITSVEQQVTLYERDVFHSDELSSETVNRYSIQDSTAPRLFEPEGDDQQLLIDYEEYPIDPDEELSDEGVYNIVTVSFYIGEE